jgi:hypothetical protein
MSMSQCAARGADMMAQLRALGGGQGSGAEPAAQVQLHSGSGVPHTGRSRCTQSLHEHPRRASG